MKQSHLNDIVDLASGRRQKVPPPNTNYDVRCLICSWKGQWPECGIDKDRKLFCPECRSCRLMARCEYEHDGREIMDEAMKAEIIERKKELKKNGHLENGCARKNGK